MSFRLPQNLGAHLGSLTGPSPLEREIMAERAASLGRAGRLVQQRLDRLSLLAPDDAERPTLVQSAADAVHSYFVQRELCGLVNHDRPIEDYAIPSAVLARLGVM